MSWFTVKNLHSFKRGPKNYRQGTWSIFYTTFLVVRGRFQLFTVVSATVLWMPDRKATAMLDCEDGETEANSNCKHCQGRNCFLTLQTNKIILISEPRLLFGNMCIIFFRDWNKVVRCLVFDRSDRLLNHMRGSVPGVQPDVKLPLNLDSSVICTHFL